MSNIHISPFRVILVAFFSLVFCAAELSGVIRTAAADEVEEELRSTIPSDPEYRGKKSKPVETKTDKPAKTKASKKSSSSDHESSEWKTMHSEKRPGKKSRKQADPRAVGVQSLKINEKTQKIVTGPLVFVAKSAQPAKESAAALKRAAQFLKGPDKNKKIRIEGFTDSVGYDSDNLTLSQQRADAVKDILVKEGVPADRLLSIGKGDRFLVASDETPLGQQKNRRVELYVDSVIPEAPAVSQTPPAQIPVAAVPQQQPVPVQPLQPQALPETAPTPQHVIVQPPAMIQPGLVVTPQPETAPAPLPVPPPATPFPSAPPTVSTTTPGTISPPATVPPGTAVAPSAQPVPPATTTQPPLTTPAPGITPPAGTTAPLSIPAAPPPTSPPSAFSSPGLPSVPGLPPTSPPGTPSPFAPTQPAPLTTTPFPSQPPPVVSPPPETNRVAP